MARKPKKSTRAKGGARKRPAEAVPERIPPPAPDSKRARARGGRYSRKAVAERSAPALKAAIIEHLATTGDTIAEALRVVNIPRATFYDWKRADRQFAAMVEEAYDAGDEVLEQELKRRGYRGDLEPVWHQGTICGHVRKRSDGALTFVLNRRERLREVRMQRAAGMVAGMVSLDLSKMSPEVRKVIRAELERQQREAAEPPGPAR